VLTLPVTHPVLLGSLSRAGHGSTVLIADGNYPHETGASPAARRVYLNFSPGLLTVSQVLGPLTRILPIERACVMAPADGGGLPLFAEYRETLGRPLEMLERYAFYDRARERDLAVLIATADQRHYANLLLTVGVRPEVEDG
jgi:L-fucose mutarotase